MTTQSAMARRWRVVVLAPALALLPAMASAQLDRRASILQAEDRRARTPQDLATLRAGTRSDDPEAARIAYRALGRLERPFLIPDILPGLRHPLPEVRAEAANALAQAAQGKEGPTAPGALASAQSALIARLAVEAEPDVRAALCESLARLPYTAAADVSRAESTLLDFAPRAATSTDRLGLAKGLEALIRIQRTVSPPSGATIDELRSLARHSVDRPEQQLLHEARVRRLALESLNTIDAADTATVQSAAADPDAQVRRLAVRAATAEGTAAVVVRALADPAPMVRIEALRASRTRNVADACGAALAATSDPDISVAIVAIDQLGTCGNDEDALTYLAHAVADPADAEAPRNWHRTAHALVALATAAPSRAASALVPYTTSRTWQLRAYAARTAGLLGNRDLLRQLATTDTDDNVVEAAISTLGSIAGHDADDVYVAALGRSGLQAIRAAALALDHTPQPERAVPALALALQRLEQDPRAGAEAVRATLGQVLSSIGAPPRASRPAAPQPRTPMTAADLRRLASPRARVTVRDVGVFDVALFTMQAPATVLAFAQLAESGYYDDLTFHRVVPDGVVEGGSPGASDFTGTAPVMRDEVGLWPHVRGAVGIATRGRDTGNGQILIDLVDNPRYDHTYTVFAQVLNGMDIVDRILEGDVIERVEILP